MEIFKNGAPAAGPRGSVPPTENQHATLVAKRELFEEFSAGRPWTLCVVATPEAGGLDYYHADVFLGELFLRRIVLDAAFENKIAAEVALTVAARKWVSEYEGVAHSGTTDFGELHS